MQNIQFAQSPNPTAVSEEISEPNVSAKTNEFAEFTRKRSPGSPDNLNRHNTATGSHQEFTVAARKAMVTEIRAALKPHPLSAETLEEIEAAREAEAAAENEADAAKTEKDALEKKHSDAVAKLEELTEAPEAIDVDEALRQKLELEKQRGRVDIIASRLPAVRSTATEARQTVNTATQRRISCETLAARAITHKAMPAPGGPLVDIHAAAAAWALDAAMHPQKNIARPFPSASLGAYLDHHFNEEMTTALVEAARGEITAVIRG